MKLAIVTASTDLNRAKPCVETWRRNSLAPVQLIVVANGTNREMSYYPAEDQILVADTYLGSVSAFRMGVNWALANTDADIIACLHDDVEIHEVGWDRIVLRHFQRHPACGLAGFGGALGLGADDIYKVPYDPMQLARVHFRSNLVDAESHGMRSLVPERVACLDGFSQIGRREFWLGYNGKAPHLSELRHMEALVDERNPMIGPWTYLEHLGVKHHLYDSLLGAIAKRNCWETWFLPMRCRHLGGATAVGDPGYQAWAKAQTNGVGDQQFWEEAHRIGYDAFRDVLPLRV